MTGFFSRSLPTDFLCNLALLSRKMNPDALRCNFVHRSPRIIAGFLSVAKPDCFPATSPWLLSVIMPSTPQKTVSGSPPPARDHSKLVSEYQSLLMGWYTICFLVSRSHAVLCIPSIPEFPADPGPKNPNGTST